MSEALQLLKDYVSPVLGLFGAVSVGVGWVIRKSLVSKADFDDLKDRVERVETEGSASPTHADFAALKLQITELRGGMATANSRIDGFQQVYEQGHKATSHQLTLIQQHLLNKDKS